MPDSTDPLVQAFIDRWHDSGAHERGTAQQFILELCQLLGVETPRPAPPELEARDYCFERGIPRIDTATGKETTVRIDCYKRGHFVLETKQGINPDETPEELQRVKQLLDKKKPVSVSRGHGVRGTAPWDKEMEKAKRQAENYVRDLPAAEGRPPFVIVCDVGYMFELHAEFSLTGGRYVRFPDPQTHRIYLTDLADPEKLQLLKTVWTDPLSLDPSKRAAAVTREISSYLATLAQTMEAEGHDSQATATFLQRCLFTMFAEDVGLLPHDGFLDLLEKIKVNPASAPTFLTALWQEMATGTPHSLLLFQEIAYFNGGLFENIDVPQLQRHHIDLLIAAAQTDWSAVEPAIFGTLLERALSPQERHKLGAHYTPRSYVERLVRPTIINPLRDQWDSIKAEAHKHDQDGKRDKAIAAVHDFHHELCRIRILDPACGSANFLYVTLEHMKRLEGEVIELLQQLGDSELTFEMEEFKVRPQQFLGLEINERAVAIAQLVLWIGYFQWHKRATGSADTNDRPLLPKARTIVQQDAVLAYDDCQPRKNADGSYLTIWDGHTTKPHPVTGKEVPDETSTKVVFDYTNPRRATWPDADYIVGNPPFIGTSRMRDLLGDGYTESLRKAWKGDVPESADFVMYWWQKAAELVRDGKSKRFGFITTNSIHQTFNRRVIEPHLANEKKPLHLAYAIPDHPWVDSASGAAVRIAMTVATADQGEGKLENVTEEHELPDGEHGVTLEAKAGLVAPNLKIGANISSAQSLLANSEISCPGVKLHGSGFIISEEEAIQLGINKRDGINSIIRGYRNGKDLTSTPRNALVIDLYGLSVTEAQTRFPEIYQRILTTVKPERDQNKRDTYRINWWIFGEPRGKFRPALRSLPRYIATVETSKHRFFTFLDQSILPDNMLVNIATDDAFYLGALSSTIHAKWALAAGGRLGYGNDPRYNKTRCFEPFPFPDLEDGELKNRIRDLGEQLDAHRKARQAEHASLTMTGMYNVLEKLRKEELLSEKDKAIHQQGIVSLLKEYHDEIDAAVLRAYGWQDLATSTPLADRLARGDEEREQQILTRLVDLNHQRAEEEKRGHIRYLRPEYQNPNYQAETQKADQTKLAIDTASVVPAAKTKLKWPKTTREQIAILKQLLPNTGANANSLSSHFGKKAPKREAQIQDLLNTLSDLGQL